MRIEKYGAGGEKLSQAQMQLFELEPVVSEMIEQAESEHAPVQNWTWNRRSTSYWSRNERSGLAGHVRISASSQRPCRHGSSRSAWRVTGSSSRRSSANIAITRLCIGRA